MEQCTKKYSVLIQGGHVIDYAQGIDGIMDVAIADGKIALVGKDIPAADAETIVRAQGKYVVPGLLDIHSHIYPLMPRPVPYAETLPTVNADAHLIKAGVTTTADAGTVGWRDFAYFKTRVIDDSKVRVLSFLNIACRGMVEMISEQEPAEHHYEVAAAVAKAYPEYIVGYKGAHYHGGRGGLDENHAAYASVDNCLRAAAITDLPVMIDFAQVGDLQTYPELLNRLRPGDIHTHCFARQFPTVGEDGKMMPYMWEARKKGIKFDLGHGAASFVWRNGLRAYQDGFPPDSLSSDLHMRNVFGNVDSMLHIMGKMLAMGMPLQEVIRRSTYEPANIIRRPELGNLIPGNCADVAILNVAKGDYDFPDCGRVTLKSDKKLECMVTIREGNILYDPFGLSMVAYENAPAEYWMARPPRRPATK